MKESKVFAIIFIIFFWACMICPIALMPLVEDSINENRNISELPLVMNENGDFNINFFDEITTYVSEHFAGRSALININNNLKYYLLKTAGDDQVIIGKKGWLFFDQTLYDYVGLTLSNDEIDNILQKMEEVQTYIEKQGKTPVFMIVPNKNTVYEEYMPKRFGYKAKLTNLSLLQVAMEERGINYLDATRVLISGKNQDELYLHQDTHWNNTGARLVLNKLYEKLDIDFSYDLDNYNIERTHESDLSAILFPTADNKENQRIYEEKNSFKYAGRVRSMDDLTIVSTNENGVGKSVLMFRDSFGRAMIPYMAECFDSCTFNRSTPYNISLVDSTECDYVVIEIVERNIKDLGDISLE